MEKRKTTVSWSEFWLYRNKPDEYYSTYILGIKEPPNRFMILGDIIHRALEDKDEEWKKMLVDNGFTPDVDRNIQEIRKYNFPPMPEKEVWLGVFGTEYPETGCQISGRADGRDKEKHIIFEYKSGQSFWDEQRVKESGQLKLYSFLHWKEFGIIPTIILFSLNVKNGKVKMFETKFTELEIKRVCADIKQMVSELKQRGWWEKRISNN